MTSLAALWDDEADRRRREGASPLNHSFLEIGDDAKRSTPPETLLARETRRKLEKIIADERQYLQETEGADAPILKPVPGHSRSFSTQEKQQAMSNGPLHQCPPLVDDRQASGPDSEGYSSPSVLFPNTPRANLTFGELQKHGIERPDAKSIAAAAREMYPTMSQVPLPEGSFAEPDVDENLVVSQSASLEEQMVDILNWMQEPAASDQFLRDEERRFGPHDVEKEDHIEDDAAEARGATDSRVGSFSG